MTPRRARFAPTTAPTLDTLAAPMFVFPGLARPTVLLDANAVRYCFKREGFTEAQLAELRRRILELSRRDLIRPFITTPVGWELTAVHGEEGEAAYLTLREFYLRLGAGRAIKNDWERKKLELTVRRKLKRTEAFVGFDFDVTMVMHRDAAYVAKLHAMQREHKDQERAAEANRRTALVATLDAQFPDWKAGYQRDSNERWSAVVRDFAKREMREDAATMGLRVRPGSWPRPDYLPTFWFGESFYFAKILFVFVETEKELTSKKSLKAMPDMMDATHFRDAAYADVFVTQDENFRAVALRARTGLRIMSFDEFATQILAMAATDVG